MQKRCGPLLPISSPKPPTGTLKWSDGFLDTHTHTVDLHVPHTNWRSLDRVSLSIALEIEEIGKHLVGPRSPP